MSSEGNMAALRYKWTKLLSSATAQDLSALARSSHAMAIQGDVGYIITGELKPRTPVPADLFKFDLKDGSSRWIPASGGATWPSPRVGAAMTATKGSLYLWGGRGGKDMGTFSGDEDLWRMDTASETWESLATKGDKPEQRSFHVMTTSADEKYVLVHAGCPASGRLGTLHALDLSTLEWTRKADAPGPGRGGTVLARLADGSGRLLRFGGFAGHETDDMAVYSLENEAWTSVTPTVEDNRPAPEARSVHSLVGVSGKVTQNGKKVVAMMCVGEREPTAKEVGHDGAGFFHNDVWALLESETGKFSWLALEAASSSASPGPEARGWLPSALWQSQDKVVLQGGLNERNERLSDAWSLELVTE